jgi:hypothetical protein
MSEKSNMGQGAPTPFGGIVNTIAGNHAYKETGTNDSGNKVTGFGSNSKEAHADFQRKGGN